MTCQELREGYDAFALGMEEQPEAEEIREHLRRDCPKCFEGVRNSTAFISRLALVAKAIEPPLRLRRRILASIEREADPREEKKAGFGFGWTLVWGAVAVIGLCVAALLGVQAHNLGALRQRDAARLSEALQIMSAPDSRNVSFGAEQNIPPRGRVVISPRLGVVLIASHLPVIEPNKTFELWLIPRNAKAIASGTFTAQNNGTAIAIQHGEVPSDLGTVAVTVENLGGVSAPTTKPIIAAKAG